MRVAVSGAHGVGKTTLLEHLGEDVKVIGNIMRSLAAEGYGIGADTDPATIAAYLRRQIALENAPSSLSYLASDRVLADGVAYVLAAVDLGYAKYPWSPGELALARAAAYLHAARYDAHVFVPIEFELSPGAYYTLGGAAYQAAVQAHLEELLSEWPIPVLKIVGSVEERTATLRKLLDQGAA